MTATDTATPTGTDEATDATGGTRAGEGSAGSAGSPTTVDAQGVPVAVRRGGAGEAALFVHGYAFTGRWLPFHERLAERVDLVAPDLPGFGATPLPDGITGFDDLVLVLRDVLDALDLERVHLVGWSFGGWAAAQLAVFHPHRVRSLTLLAPFGLRVPDAPLTDFFAAAPDVRQALPFNGDPSGHEDLLVDPRSPEGFAALYAEAAAAARYMWNPRYDVKLDRRLPHLRVPALVVAAGDDRIVPRAHADRWVELLPDARLEVVPGAGHGLVVQQPERCADLVASFATTGVPTTA